MASDDEPQTPYYISSTYDADGQFKGHALDIVAYSNFLKEHFHIVYYVNTIYIYDPERNVYCKAHNEIQTHIRDTIVEFNIGGKLTALTRELMHHLECMGQYFQYPFNRDTADIPLENGVLRIDYATGVVTLMPHGAEHMFTFKLPVKYDPAVPSTIVTDLFSQWVDNVDQLLQIPSQTFLQMHTGNCYRKAHLLQGIGNNGKSGFVELNERFFGDGNTSSISLHDMCDDKFAMFEMEGKLLNIFDELRDVSLNTIEKFKVITGGVTIRVIEKYRTGHTAYVPCANVFTCNAAPSYNEKVRRDNAFWQRWEFIRFPNIFPVDPGFYERTFTPEFMSSYLNAIIKTMLKMKQTGDLLIRSDVPTVMEQWSANGDPLYQFIQWGFNAADGKVVNKYSKVKMQEAYLHWCHVNQIPEHRRLFTQTAFTKAIQYNGFVAARLQRMVDGDRLTYEVYETADFVLNRGVIPELNYANDAAILGIPIGNTQTLGL